MGPLSQCLRRLHNVAQANFLALRPVKIFWVQPGLLGVEGLAKQGLSNSPVPHHPVLLRGVLVQGRGHLVARDPVSQPEPGLVELELKNSRQLLRAIIGEIDRNWEAPRQPRVRLQKLTHVISIPGHDYQGVPGGHVLHDFFNGLGSKILPVGALDQPVGLVHKKHAPPRLLDHLPGLGPGLTHVLCYQIRPLDLHKIGALGHPQSVQQPPHQPGHRRLPRPRRSPKNHVPGVLEPPGSPDRPAAGVHFEGAA
mmetsp:Transcript_64996/g.149119  ORF Transcript_64996/g.149119 Transcript_64996/m.149119 type:complete len:253 (-) Transcript_64996:314-1072(-)